MLSPGKPIARRPYLLIAFGLLALKVALDVIISLAFGHGYSPRFYLSPIDLQLFKRPEGDWSSSSAGYFFSMWAVAVPFLSLGVVLTMRRVRDIGISPFFALLFFVPIVNLIFFVVCAVTPSKKRATGPTSIGEGAYRTTDLPPPSSVRRPPRSFRAAVLLGGAIGAAVGLAAVGISVGIMREYGFALMLGAPVLTGFAASLTFARLHNGPITPGGSVLAISIAFSIGYGLLIAFALEGAVCLVMAFPLLAASAAVGGFIGHAVGKSFSMPGGGLLPTGAAMLLAPGLAVMEHFEPPPQAQSQFVESTLVVNAPPDAVWNRVVSFPDLDPPTEAIFRLGVAAPMRARIDGAGPGAIRRCEFTTGAFVEPIEVWKPGRELTFSVTSQPDPMREWTLWRGPRPPHLDGYLQTTRGQFLLEPLDGGRTKLTGRTWYRTNMAPEPYWRLFADQILHHIHLRVMGHVAKLAEHDVHSARE